MQLKIGVKQAEMGVEAAGNPKM